MTLERFGGCDSAMQRYLKSLSDRADKISFMRQTVQNANVLTRGELDKYIGMDAVESIKGISANEEEKLADLIESNVLLHIKSNNPNIAKVSKEELMSKPKVVDTFRAVVVAWLINVALFLSFGRVRYEAIRDAWYIRNNLGHTSFAYIHWLLIKNIYAINAQMKKYAVDEVIERMRKQIDKSAMGNQSVVVDKELYKRKIEPRLQQYWKKVKEAFTMSEQEVSDRMKEISDRYGDFSEVLADNKDGKGSEGVEPTEETLLERDLAQLEYVALQRFGALAEHDLGYVADKVHEVAQDITLTRRRLVGGYSMKMMTWSRWKIFEEFRSRAWGEAVTDVVLMAKCGSTMAVCERVGTKMSADLIDFYDDDEIFVQSLMAVVARRALKSSGFEEVPGALEDAYHTVDTVFNAVCSRNSWKREGQKLLWQLIRWEAHCCSAMLDFAYEKVVSSLEQSEKLKHKRIALLERKRAKERAKLSYRLGWLVGRISNWLG